MLDIVTTVTSRYILEFVPVILTLLMLDRVRFLFEGIVTPPDKSEESL